jgi:hypothetical protein
MKFSIRSFLLLTVGCVFFVGLGLSGAVAAPIPESALAGTYTNTGGGSLAFCTGPAPTFKQKDCSKFIEGTDHVFPFTFVQLGEVTRDAKGNSCATITQAYSDSPLDSSPPLVQTVHNVGNIPSYDPSTGVGDNFVTGYSGGRCNGAVFNSTGATKTATSLTHFVASDEGKRIDFIGTKLQNLTGSVGDFSITVTQLKRP